MLSALGDRRSRATRLTLRDDHDGAGDPEVMPLGELADGGDAQGLNTAPRLPLTRLRA